MPFMIEISSHLLFSFLLCLLLSVDGGLVIHIDHIPLDKDKPALRIISFCLDWLVQFLAFCAFSFFV